MRVGISSVNIHLLVHLYQNQHHGTNAREGDKDKGKRLRAAAGTRERNQMTNDWKHVQQHILYHPISHSYWNFTTNFHFHSRCELVFRFND